MKCWMCGAEPETCEIISMEDRQPVLVIGSWPASDDGHEHAERPPTPGQLEQSGHEALMRIRGEATR